MQINVLNEALALSINSEADCIEQIHTLKQKVTSLEKSGGTDIQYLRNAMTKLLTADNPKVFSLIYCFSSNTDCATVYYGRVPIL